MAFGNFSKRANARPGNETVDAIGGAPAQPKPAFAPSALIAACETGDFDRALYLLRNGANPNMRSPDGRTTLFFCKEVALVSLLIHYGADVNATDKEGNTPLMNILKGENRNSNGERAVVVLIEAGTNTEIRNSDGLNARDIAASRKATPSEFQQSLIGAGVDVTLDAHDEMYVAYKQGLRVVDDKRKRVHELNERQRVEREGWLAESDPMNPNYDFNRLTIECFNACALSEISVLKAHEDWVRNFINLTISRKDYSNKTMLMMACENASAEIVEYLISLGADVNLVDGLGQTALRYVAMSWFDIDEKIELLLKAGADINQRWNDGSAALSDAAWNQNVVAAKSLIKHGADVNNRDTHGYTALSWTCGRGAPDADMVELLLRYGADANDLYNMNCVLQFIDYYTSNGRTLSREITLRPQDLTERHLYEHSLLPAMITASGRAKLDAQGFYY